MSDAGPSVPSPLPTLPLLIHKKLKRDWLLQRIPSGRAYRVWKRQFLEDRCCDSDDFAKEVLISALPHIFLNLLLIAYLVFGACLFQLVDEGLRSLHFRECILFSFTTISTIGYGNIAPTTLAGQILCVAYCVVGIPLIFLVLSNDGHFIIDAYAIIRASCSNTRRTEVETLPVPVTLLLLLLHTLLGGIIYSSWIDAMSFSDAIYFSFISVSTIGFGDLSPTPDSYFQLVVTVSYLATGMVILSTLTGSLSNFLRRIHYIGRRFHGAGEVSVWFGGTVMSVSELVQRVAANFDVSPQRIHSVIRDLDDLLTIATDPQVENRVDTMRQKSEEIKRDTTVLLVDRKKSVIVRRSESTQPSRLSLASSTSSFKLHLTDSTMGGSNESLNRTIREENQKVIQALAVVYQTLHKQPHHAALIHHSPVLSQKLSKRNPTV